MNGQRANAEITRIVENVVKNIEDQMQSRSVRAANELSGAVKHILRGQRSGRRYRVPKTYRRQRGKATGRMRKGVYYTASAPGEPPANRTGVFRLSFNQTKAYAERMGRVVHYHSQTGSSYRVKGGRLLGEMLENGTRRMLPRPYMQPTIDRAMPNIIRIYSAPYIR